MTASPNLLNKIGRLFKRNPTNGEDNGADQSLVVQTRPGLLRSWGRNNAAISQLQQGFQLLTELMQTIRHNMEDQGRRQDELIQHVAALPKALETIPETARIQGEALKLIHQQLLSQVEQQQTLGDILEKLAEAGGDQKELMEGLRERVDTLNRQDQAMADSLNTVSSALESVSRHSATSAQVLGNMRDNLTTRDVELESVLRRQATRFTAMLAMAVFLSIGAVVAVVVMGYMVLHAHVGK